MRGGEGANSPAQTNTHTRKLADWQNHLKLYRQNGHTNSLRRGQVKLAPVSLGGALTRFERPSQALLFNLLCHRLNPNSTPLARRSREQLNRDELMRDNLTRTLNSIWITLGGGRVRPTRQQQCQAPANFASCHCLLVVPAH